MIKKNTVLILGAGASAPYGYPSGELLLKQIVSLASDKRFLQFLDDLSSSGDPINRRNFRDVFDSFAINLSASGLLSVDSFIVVKPQFAEIFKFAITYVLLRIEADNKFSVSENEDWYRYLYHNFIDKKNIGDIFKNKITFVTFNYDVSLDGFFLHAINSKFPHQARMFFENIEVLHIHGKIRSFPWVDNPLGNTPLDFGFDMSKKF